MENNELEASILAGNNITDDIPLKFWEDYRYCVLCGEQIVLYFGMTKISVQYTDSCYHCSETARHNAGRMLKPSNWFYVAKENRSIICRLCHKNPGKVVLMKDCESKEGEVIAKGWFLKKRRDCSCCDYCFKIHWANKDGSVPEVSIEDCNRNEPLYVRYNENTIKYKNMIVGKMTPTEICLYCGYENSIEVIRRTIDNWSQEIKFSRCDCCWDIEGEDLVVSNYRLMGTSSGHNGCAHCKRQMEGKLLIALRSECRSVCKDICGECYPKYYELSENNDILFLKCSVKKLIKNANN